MTVFDLPQRPPRVRVRTVVTPAVAAMMLAAMASFAEVRTVGFAWSACDVGINASANGFVLLFELPVLWLAQTVMIAVPAPLLALLSRRRLVVTVAMALLASVVLTRIRR